MVLPEPIPTVTSWFGAGRLCAGGGALGSLTPVKGYGPTMR